MITIISISDGFQHFEEAIDIYISRLGKSIQEKKIKPVKHTLVSYIKREETKKLKEVLKKMKWHIFLCDERGSTLNTIKFGQELSKIRTRGEDIIFIIGWSYGVDLEEFWEILHTTLRFSDFVLPHGLAYLVLVEQLYRIWEIEKWSKYHHE
jgi:23S rRNA (pseudouridine1915-N3)-methyltransferase